MMEIIEALKLGTCIYIGVNAAEYAIKIGDRIGYPDSYKLKGAKLYLALPWPFDWAYAMKKWGGHCHPIDLSKEQESLKSLDSAESL